MTKVLGFKIEVLAVDKAVDLVSKLKNELKALTEQRKKLDAEKKKDIQTTQKLTGEINKLKAAGKGDTAEVKKKEAALKRLNTNINITDKEVKGLTKSEILLKGKLKDANTELRKTDKTAKLVKGSIAELRVKTSEMIATLNNSVAVTKKERFEREKTLKTVQKNKKAIRDFDRSVSGSNTLVGEYSKGFTNAFAKIGVAVVAVMAAWRGLNRVIGGVVDIITEFDQSMKDVAAITLGTAEEVAALEAQAKKLGATTVFTASQVVSLEKELAKLGFETKDIIAGSGGILALASAMDEDLGQSAKVAGASIRQFGLDASDMNRVVDVMTLGFARSALDLSKFETAMSKAAPIARQYGFSIEETTAFIGELTNAGFEASMAGTAFRNILLNLADANGDLAQRLGGSVDTSEGLLVALEQLKNEGVNLNEILQLTDKRSAGAFAQFLEGTDNLKKLTHELNNAGGTAQRMADIQLESVRSRTKLLTSAWQGWILSIDSGNGLISTAIKGLADFGSYILGTITKTDGLSTAISNEKSELTILIGSITSLNEENELRDRLLEDLNTKYPDLLKNLDIETVSNEELSHKLADVNLEYAKKIRLAIKAEEVARIEAATTEQLKIQEESAKRVTKLYAEYYSQLDQNVPLEEKVITLRKEMNKTDGYGVIVKGKLFDAAQDYGLATAKIYNLTNDYNNILSEKAEIEKEAVSANEKLTKLSTEYLIALSGLSNEELRRNQTVYNTLDAVEKLTEEDAKNLRNLHTTTEEVLLIIEARERQIDLYNELTGASRDYTTALTEEEKERAKILEALTIKELQGFTDVELKKLNITKEWVNKRIGIIKKASKTVTTDTDKSAKDQLKFQEELSTLLIENIQDKTEKQINAELDRHEKQKLIYENDVKDEKLRDKLIAQELIKHQNNLKKIIGETDIQEITAKIYDTSLKNLKSVLNEEIALENERWEKEQILHSDNFELIEQKLFDHLQRLQDIRAAAASVEALEFEPAALEEDEEVPDVVFGEGELQKQAEYYARAVTDFSGFINDITVKNKEKKETIEELVLAGVMSEEEGAKEIAKINADSANKRIALATGVFNTLQQIAGAESKIGRALAVAQQAYMLGEAAIALKAGLIGTAKVGFPQAIPLMVAFLAATGGLLASMKNLKIPKEQPIPTETIEAPRFVKGGQAGGKVKGKGTGTSDSIPAMLSNGEVTLRAAPMRSADNIAVEGTPIQIANALNSYRSPGAQFAASVPVRKLAVGGLPTVSTPSISTTQITNNEFNTDFVNDIIQKTIEGISQIPVNVLENDISEKQRLVTVSNDAGDF